MSEMTCARAHTHTKRTCMISSMTSSLGSFDASAIALSSAVFDSPARRASACRSSPSGLPVSSSRSRAFEIASALIAVPWLACTAMVAAIVDRMRCTSLALGASGASSAARTSFGSMPAQRASACTSASRMACSSAFNCLNHTLDGSCLRERTPRQRDWTCRAPCERYAAIRLFKYCTG